MASWFYDFHLGFLSSCFCAAIWVSIITICISPCSFVSFLSLLTKILKTKYLKLKCFLKTLTSLLYLYLVNSESKRHLKNGTAIAVQSEYIIWVIEMYYIGHIWNILVSKTCAFFKNSIGIVVIHIESRSYFFIRKYRAGFFWKYPYWKYFGGAKIFKSNPQILFQLCCSRFWIWSYNWKGNLILSIKVKIMFQIN